MGAVVGCVAPPILVQAAAPFVKVSVGSDRANVRRKLGLPKGGPRLGTHLAALGRD